MMARETSPIQESVTVAKPAPAVFRALTDSDEVASWFAEDAYIELCEGGRYEILGRQGWKKGRVSRLEDNRRLVVSWPIEVQGDSEETTTIDISLESRGDKTVVTISHLGVPVGEPVYLELKEGWSQALADFSRFVEGQFKGKPRNPLT